MYTITNEQQTKIAAWAATWDRFDPCNVLERLINVGGRA
jgi:hypothetical protein